MKTLLCSLVLVTSVALAQAQDFIANLNGAQEAVNPGTRSGSGIFNLTLTGTTITISGDFSGLSGTLQNAHIHSAAPAGANAGVLYSLLSFITPGADNKSGAISATINLEDNANNRGFDVGTQLGQLNGGLWYFNIHSTTFAGGEIRGQILPVPEPSTLALGAMGLAGLVLWGARRRSS